MKLFHLMLAASLCGLSTAQAQTTPPAQRSPSTLTPGSAAPALPPNSADNTRRALPATGTPDALDNTPLAPKNQRDMNRGKHKGMSHGKDKMKTKM